MVFFVVSVQSVERMLLETPWGSCEVTGVTRLKCWYRNYVGDCYTNKCMITNNMLVHNLICIPVALAWIPHMQQKLFAYVHCSLLKLLWKWWRHQMETFSALLPLVRGIHRWITLTKANDAELWCFLWYVTEQTVELTTETRWFETPPCSLWRHCNVQAVPCHRAWYEEVDPGHHYAYAKGQWRGALMFSLFCARINDWVNNREAGDLWRHRAHYDVIVMIQSLWC